MVAHQPSPSTPTSNDDAQRLRASRRQLLQDSMGIMVSAGGFGLVYGLTAAKAGFSPFEAGSMSVLVFAGAAQFVAIGYVLGGLSWLVIVGLTAFLQARHLLYAAALAPFLTDQPRWMRALMAYVLTDEAFALAIAHFRRIGRGDVRGYWMGAIVSTFIPWNVATLIGVTVGSGIPEPERFGLDVIFPAAMGGLAIGLITGRRELVAGIAGALLGVAIGLVWDPAAGVIAGGLLGPLFGLAVRPRASEHHPAGQLAYGPEPGQTDEDDHEEALSFFPQHGGHARHDPAHDRTREAPRDQAGGGPSDVAHGEVGRQDHRRDDGRGHGEHR
jgi:4-azaleucine resistance transporter AzlC